MAFMTVMRTAPVRQTSKFESRTQSSISLEVAWRR